MGVGWFARARLYKIGMLISFFRDPEPPWVGDELARAQVKLEKAMGYLTHVSVVQTRIILCWCRHERGV